MNFSHFRRTHGSRWVLAFLAVLLLTASAKARPQEETEPGIHIVVLQGDRALNAIKQRSSQDVAVRVEDQSGQPLSGVPVTFQLPAVGPSGRFPDDSLVMMRTTDAKGETRVSGLRPNDVQGDFQIQVTATHGGQSVTALIKQSNVMAVDSSPGRSFSNKRLIAILAAAGAAGAAIALSQGGGKNGASSSGPFSSGPVSAGITPTAPAPISIIPGTPVVTGPR